MDRALLGVFDFGSASFNRINNVIRHEVIAESVTRFTTVPSDAADWPMPQYRHLRLDNAPESPGRTAERIVRELGLPPPAAC